jgi:hypothetical protein
MTTGTLTRRLRAGGSPPLTDASGAGPKEQSLQRNRKKKTRSQWSSRAYPSGSCRCVAAFRCPSVSSFFTGPLACRSPVTASSVTACHQV